MNVNTIVHPYDVKELVARWLEEPQIPGGECDDERLRYLKRPAQLPDRHIGPVTQRCASDVVRIGVALPQYG